MKLITFVSTAAVLMATAATAQAADLSATEAQQLESSLGAHGAGVYVDGGEAVVNVTSEAAAEQVEAAGATAKIVEHSDAELARVDETIKVAGNVPGMSWGTDPVTNQVVVTLDPTVDAAEQAHVEAALASRRRRGAHRAHRRGVHAARRGRRGDLHRQLALLARVQRPQRGEPELLPHRRALHEHRRPAGRARTGP